MPSTVAARAPGCTCLTMPRLPFSLPRRMRTVSPLRMFSLLAMRCLQYLRRQRSDLQEAAVAKFAHDGTEDARAARIEIVFFALDDDAGVVVAADDGAVLAADGSGGADDHGLDDLTL